MIKDLLTIRWWDNNLNDIKENIALFQAPIEADNQEAIVRQLKNISNKTIKE
jgi:hypothetical protein